MGSAVIFSFEAMTEADNVPNYQRRVVLRAVTFNNLCCCLTAINREQHPQIL